MRKIMGVLLVLCFWVLVLVGCAANKLNAPVKIYEEELPAVSSPEVNDSMNAFVEHSNTFPVLSELKNVETEKKPNPAMQVLCGFLILCLVAIRDED